MEKVYEYHVRVDRGPLPRLKELKEWFLSHIVWDIFGWGYEWIKHSSRTGPNDVTAGEVIILVKYFSPEEIEEMGGLVSENIIAYGLKNDVVPADEKEVYAYGVDLKTADPRSPFSLVGLGSSTLYDSVATMAGPPLYYGEPHVAVLAMVSGKRCLLGAEFDRTWFADDGFLFTRKETP